MEEEVEMTKKEEKENKEGKEGNEPIFYNPKILTLISSLANVFSWFVLVGYLADVVAQFLNVRNTLTQQGMTFNAELFKDPSALSYLITNLGTPFFTGVALFLVLQGVAIGLNVLYELDMNARESGKE
jgi:hypothetical protein